MKVLCVIPSLSKGGAERVLSVLSKEWAKEHDVLIVLFNHQNKSYSVSGKEIALELPSSSNKIRKSTNFFIRIVKLVRILREEKPDKIISFMETANVPTFFAALLTFNLSRHIVSVHNNPKYFPKVFQKLISILYPFTYKIVTVSEGIKKELMSSKYRLPQEKLVSIPNPIEFHEIQKLSNENEPVLWDNQFPTFIAMGRLHNQKGFDYLIEAFSKVNKAINSQLVILGEGPERETLENITVNLGIKHRVIMPGIVNNPFAYLKRADIFILSSRYEGWGNVLVEALASEVPVISFNCEFGPSEILDGRYGKLVEAEKIDKLAETMTDLLGNPELCKELKYNGLERAKVYDSKNLANRWLR